MKMPMKLVIGRFARVLCLDSAVARARVLMEVSGTIARIIGHGDRDRPACLTRKQKYAESHQQ